MERYDGKTIKRRSVRTGFLIALFFVVSGTVFRLFTANVGATGFSTVVLTRHLSELPLSLNDWQGQDAPLSDTVKRVVGHDEHISRVYQRQSTGSWTNLFVSFSSTSVKVLGHNPQVCYVATGWVSDGYEKIALNSASGKEFECESHHFHRPAPESEHTVVISFYVVNGITVADDAKFHGISWRSLKLHPQGNRYITRVQVSSPLEASAREFAEVLYDELMEFMPSVD